jgi:hypothetical protein
MCAYIGFDRVSIPPNQHRKFFCASIDLYEYLHAVRVDQCFYFRASVWPRKCCRGWRCDNANDELEAMTSFTDLQCCNSVKLLCLCGYSSPYSTQKLKLIRASSSSWVLSRLYMRFSSSPAIYNLPLQSMVKLGHLLFQHIGLAFSGGWSGWRYSGYI